MNNHTYSFELSRKAVHLSSLAVPLCAYYSLFAAQIILLFFIVFYSFSEWRKTTGKPFFAHPLIFRMQRDEELHCYARAPLFLAIGVLLAITLFSWKASLIGIYMAGFCDTMAALCGKKFGRTKLPFFSRKTYAGSMAFLIAALPISFYFLPPSKAIIISVTGAFLESLPFKDWDNLTIPLGITFLAEQFLF
ncbi:MAG: hypothetical protein HYU99_01040 [Deltaproteobacteria bacterium]|nr:hypothetical protein [Deltaproteobacteria bacterium]